MTALQLPARWNQPDAQLRLTEALLARGPKTDLALLPEAALTGYVSPDGDFDLSPFAEPLSGPTHAAYASLARRFDCLLVGPVIEREGPRCFNSLVGVTPDGATLLHYRKHHPWYPETWASAGERWCPTVRWRGVALTVALCFDLHFLPGEPDDAQLLLFSSAWVDPDDTRPALLQALARARRLEVLNANWGSGPPLTPGQGGSLHVDRDGAVTARLQQEAGRLDRQTAAP